MAFGVGGILLLGSRRGLGLCAAGECDVENKQLGAMGIHY
jgi:hypothetical protein